VLPDNCWTCGAARRGAAASPRFRFRVCAPVETVPWNCRPGRFGRFARTRRRWIFFPTTLWAQSAARRLRRVSATCLPVERLWDYRPLRQAVADYLSSSRGVKCTADQVLVLSGAQEALDPRRASAQPGRMVWMEEPGYAGGGGCVSAVARGSVRFRGDGRQDLDRGLQRWKSVRGWPTSRRRISFLSV